MVSEFKLNPMKLSDISKIRDEEWPMLGANPEIPSANRRLSFASSTLHSPRQLVYKSTTAGGKQRDQMMLAEEIRQSIFSGKKGSDMQDLDAACLQLDADMGSLSQGQWRCEAENGEQVHRTEREVEDELVTDSKFNHSWTPHGPGPGLGWYWIPKGKLSMDIFHPARQDEIRVFGHLVRTVQRVPPPAPLVRSFSCAVEANMANQGRPMKRRVEDWRQEGWMEEDDLLQEDFQYEQDLRKQLQRGPRPQGEGAMGRKTEGTGMRSMGPGGQDPARVPPGKGAMGGRMTGNQPQGQQGVWPQQQQHQQGSWGWGHGQRGGRIHNHGGRSTGSAGEWHSREVKQESNRDGNRERDMVPIEGTRKNNQDIKCFRCLGTGHFQVDCTNEPVCYKCKEKGHMAVDCKSSEPKKIKMFGFGIPGQGFYSLNFPETKIKTHQSTGLLTILKGDATEEKVDRELKNLVREKWDFRVRQIHLNEYLVVFPDKNSMDTFIKLSEFQMSLFGLKGRLERTARDPETSSLLQTIWLKIQGVPELAREVEVVKEIVSLVAEPMFVDELSLIKDEPIRVQGRCRNPDAIRGSIEIFFNGVGKMISFEVEKGNQRDSKKGKKGSQGQGKPDDKSDRDTDKNNKDDFGKKGGGKFDRIGKIDTEMDSGHEESMEEDMDEPDKGNNDKTCSIPLAAFHPGIGLVDLQHNEEDKQCGLENCSSASHPRCVDKFIGDEKDEAEVFSQKDGSESQEQLQLEVHGSGEGKSMERCKWPALKVVEKVIQDSEEGGSLTQEDTLVSPKLVSLEHQEQFSLKQKQLVSQMLELSTNLCGEDMMDNVSNMGGDSEDENKDKGWQISKTKRARKAKKVVVASRTSSRVPRDGVSIITRASQRAMERDNVAGNTGTSFTILNSVPNSILKSVLDDLDVEMGNSDEQLDAFKAEEVARAKIAEANYKTYLEKLKQKTAPQSEEDESDLAMGVISNSNRESTSTFLKGREVREDSGAYMGDLPVKSQS